MTLLKKAALLVGAAAVPLSVAFVGAGTASAGPDLCVSGPFGYAYACVDTPGWVGWYDDGPRGRGHWDGHGHGHGHDD